MRRSIRRGKCNVRLGDTGDVDGSRTGIDGHTVTLIGPPSSETPVCTQDNTPAGVYFAR
jgi:hypothetical protein